LLERMSLNSISRFFLAAIVAGEKVRATVVAYNFEQSFVGGVDVFKFEIEDGVDTAFTEQRAHPVLPAEAGEYRTLASGGLAVEIDFGGPPSLHAILELESSRDESISVLGSAGDALSFDFEVAGLLQFMGVGDEIVFLGVEWETERKRQSQ